MIVTSYYDIYNNPTNFDKFINSFSKLANSNIPITLFTEPTLVSNFLNFPSSVKVIGIPLDYFKLYKIANNYQRELPNSRNYSKDTKQYLALLNTKIEFILRASEICDEETFIWCDFGILNHIKNHEEFLFGLQKINKSIFNKVVIPGIWQFGHSFSTDELNCRFCGNFFIIPRKYIQIFFEHSGNVLNDFCNLQIYKLCWETNIWNIIEACAMRNEIDWYYADKDDTLIHNIQIAINQ